MENIFQKLMQERNKNIIPMKDSPALKWWQVDEYIKRFTSGISISYGKFPKEFSDIMTSEIFTEMEKAIEYLKAQGFNYWSGKHVPMDEGYEHVFVFEYTHREDKNLVCRIADMRSAQYKAQPGDRLPRIIGFIQVSIKKVNQP